MILTDAYEEEKLEDGDVRTVMHFHPKIAPITVAVLPLVKKDGIAELAKEIEQGLREDFATFYDQSGAIGRRYRRMDEVGTPFCVTVDYDSKEAQYRHTAFPGLHGAGSRSCERALCPDFPRDQKLQKRLKNEIRLSGSKRTGLYRPMYCPGRAR
jgi:hypothetical protein